VSISGYKYQSSMTVCDTDISTNRKWTGPARESYGNFKRPRG